MLHWQFALVLVVCLTAVCWAWPTDEDDTKACAQIGGSSYGNAKCRAYCISKNKKGGACEKKRCVCNDDGNSKENDRKKRQLPSSADTELDFCRFYCQNLEEFIRYPIKEKCDCTRL